MRAGVLVLMAGCWRGPTVGPVTPEPEPPLTAKAANAVWKPSASSLRCDAVVANVFEKTRAELVGLSEQTIAELQTTLIAGCVELAWSSEALQCWDTIATGNEANRCQAEMSREQNDDMMRRMMDVVSRGYGAPPPPPPPGP